MGERMKRKKPSNLRKAAYLIQAGIPGSLAIAFLFNSLLPYRPASGRTRTEFESYISEKDFSTRWFLGKIPVWERVFEETGLVRKSDIRGLEIGSWEGMSSLYLLRRFPSLQMTCVDTWDGGDEHGSRHGERLSDLEKRFDRNVGEFSDRVAKYRGTSSSFFSNTGLKETYDIIYIDGSHHANDVILDAISAFELLNIGGVMIFDDFTWAKYSYLRNNPATAIAAFLMMKKGLYRIVRVSRQVIIQKTRHGGRDLKA